MEAAAESSELHEHGRRSACRSDHCQLSVLAPQTGVKLDQGAEPGGIDEADLGEIDHQPLSVPANRLGERGAEAGDAGEVNIALGSDDGWFSQANPPTRHRLGQHV